MRLSHRDDRSRRPWVKAGDRLEPTASTDFSAAVYALRTLGRAASPSIADIVMADVLRLVDRFDGLSNVPGCRSYMARATARSAFAKALSDQMAHFEWAD